VEKYILNVFGLQSKLIQVGMKKISSSGVFWEIISSKKIPNRYLHDGRLWWHEENQTSRIELVFYLDGSRWFMKQIIFKTLPSSHISSVRFLIDSRFLDLMTCCPLPLNFLYYLVMCAQYNSTIYCSSSLKIDRIHYLHVSLHICPMNNKMGTIATISSIMLIGLSWRKTLYMGLQ
jgi:hypothetical protein